MINQEQMIKIRKSQEGLERSQAPGGSVCYTMRAMAILGAKAGFIGKIGSDSVGEYYEEALKKANVSPYFAKTDGISGSCTVLISPDGERTMGTFLGPAPTITPDEITEEMLSASLSLEKRISTYSGIISSNSPRKAFTILKLDRSRATFNPNFFAFCIVVRTSSSFTNR